MYKRQFRKQGGALGGGSVYASVSEKEISKRKAEGPTRKEGTPAYTLGAHGSIAAILTAAPRHSTQLWDAVQAGNHPAAHELHLKLLRLWNALMPHDNLPAATKFAQNLQGVPSGLPRQPMPPAGPEQQQRIQSALENLVLSF